MKKMSRGSRVLCILIVFLLVFQAGIPFMGLGKINAFAATGETEDFQFETVGGSATITKYTGAGGSFIIPATVTYGLDTYSVTSIGVAAFASCSSLTSITIPNGVTSIGYSAFYGCSSLTSVTIPNSVTSIEPQAFFACSSLTSVAIPSGVPNIGSYTFYACSKLTSVTIPNSVTSIGEGAFFECSSLTSVTIPNGVTSIGEWAFTQCSGLTSITIPTSVTSIGKWALAYCRGLTSITIPNGVTSIGGWAFYGCSSLTNVTIPNSVTSIGDNAFQSCFVLEVACFMGNAPSLGMLVFDSCANPFEVYYIDGNTGFSNPWYGYCTDTFIPDRLCNVTFDSQGGNTVGPTSTTFNTTITPPTTPTRLGYTFDSWYKESACINAWNFVYDKVRADITLYATWSLNRYSIRYYLNNGTNNWQNPISYIFDETQGVTLSHPTRTGYTFAGWYDNADFTGSAVNTIPAGSTGDVSFYAKWTINQYTVTFNSQGGSTVGSVLTDYEAGITAPTTPTRTGYIFGGWYKEASCTNPWNFGTDKVTSATILYAKWVATTYMIAFNGNGSTTGSMSNLGMTYDASKALPANTFAKTGYSFAGWATSPTGAVTYANQVSVKNLANTSGATVTLYAKWIPNTYTIKFNINGGTSGTMASVAMTYDTSKSLTTNVFKKTGYSFLGWATTSTGAVVYKNSAAVKNLTATKGATINLYAKWGAPILSATSYNYTSIKVSWAYAGSATSYKIYRATSATGTYSLVYTASSTARSWVDTGQTTGKTYYYKVYPVAGGKTYTHSTYKYAKAIPTTPSMTLTKASTTSIKITWTGVSGATKYQVYRATSATGTYSLVYTASSTLRYWTNTGLTAGKTYYYKVRAYHLEGTTKVYGSTSAVKYLKL